MQFMSFTNNLLHHSLLTVSMEKILVVLRPIIKLPDESMAGNREFVNFIDFYEKQSEIHTLTSQKNIIRRVYNIHTFDNVQCTP